MTEPDAEQQRFKERVGHQVENRRIPCLHAKRENM